MTLRLREGREQDLPLIEQAARKEELDDRGARPEQFAVAERQGQVVGFGRLVAHDDCWEIGCLYVAAGQRRQGTGSAIVAALVARVADGRPIYAVAAVPEFFAAAGFVPAAQMPPAIAGKYGFCCREYQAQTVVMRYAEADPVGEGQT